MKFKKTVLHAALVSAMGGTSLLATTDASAISLVIDGQYQLQILITPTATRSTTYGMATESFFQVGSQSSGWNTSFTFGSGPPTEAGSQGITDNNQLVTITNDWSATFGPDAGPGAKGTSVVDGFAGLITFDVVNGNIRNATSFSADTIFRTRIGTWASYVAGNDLSGFTGSIDAAGGMAFTPTGRMGAQVGAQPGGLIDRWNIDARGAAAGPWNQFTTGSVSTDLDTITGSACSGAAGNYACTLVSGGLVGPDLGLFVGTDYFEVWNTNLVRTGNASPVPVPAALWLFGSGLVGLMSVTRRPRRKAKSVRIE